MASASDSAAGHPDGSAATAATSAQTQSAAVVEWIRSAAIPLATVEARQGFADLAPFRAIIGDARIVSLGEATHGTREFFQLKHRLLEFCVTELGFTIFGIEASFPESLAVNAYVLDGVGNAADALAGTRFWTWDTEEVLDLIEWMRWWNMRNRRKVRFYGFDMQYPAVAALELIDFLARVAPELAASCAHELAPLTSDFTAELFGKLPASCQESVFACIARVRDEFERNRSAWIVATRAVDWQLGRFQARVLAQSAQMAVADGVRKSAIRDRAMAENVCALLAMEGPDAKAVIWSHNGHAKRIQYAADLYSMGEHLDALVGPAQRVIGFSFGRGFLQARGYPSGNLAVHHVAGAMPNSFDSSLAQAGLPLFALDLANGPRAGAVAEWLSTEAKMRSVGALFAADREYMTAVVPRAQFDAMIFVAETTAARPNRAYIPRPEISIVAAPANLLLDGEGVPSGWQAPGLARIHAHKVVASDVPSPTGGRTVCISRDAAPWRWGDGQIVQWISAQAWHGKRLRFAAAIRTMAEGIGSGAQLFVKFLPKPEDEGAHFFVRPLATVSVSAQPLQSPDWAEFAVEADVPDAADCFVIGLVMTGNGTAWFGDLDLSEVLRTLEDSLKPPK